MKRLLVATLLALSATTAALIADEPKAAEAPKADAPKSETPAAESAENKIVVGVIPAVMQYDKKAISVKAGENVALFFTNKGCPLQHNLIILKPGTDAAFGGAADKMILTDAAGAMAKHYCPDDAASKAAIIAATSKLIGPGQNETLRFTAPAEPGDYPYLCTFPGHRFLMKGVMTVTK